MLVTVSVEVTCKQIQSSKVTITQPHCTHVYLQKHLKRFWVVLSQVSKEGACGWPEATARLQTSLSFPCKTMRSSLLHLIKPFPSLPTTCLATVISWAEKFLLFLHFLFTQNPSILAIPPSSTWQLFSAWSTVFFSLVIMVVLTSQPLSSDAGSGTLWQAEF